MKDLKSQLTVVNSEMKANMSAFDRSDKSIEKYETRLRGLNRKLEVQQSVTESARKTYEKMVKEHGEGSKEAQKAAKEYNNQVASLNNLSRYVGRVEDDLAKLKEEQRISNSNWTKMGNKLDSAGNKMQAFGDRVSGVGNVMSTTLTPAVLGAGAAMGVVASSYEDSAVKIQNSLGLTAEEAKELTDISRNIYKNGFGESAEEIDHALLQTKQNIRDLNNEDLERITEKAFLLADTFESDVNEVTRAGNNVMKGFGIEADEAFDLMARGAQNGLNFSNEMFDNLSEYSTLFANMGYSAEEYFELLQKGTDAGVYNLDYINDVMKEFQIRIKDGSKTTTDAMGELSESTQEVWEQFEDGDKTVKDMSNAVLKELEGMDDQVAANQIGVELFGTKWEDLESTAMYSMSEIGEGIEDVDGTMDDMTKNAEQSILKQWKATWREAKEVLLPVGDTLLDFTRDVLPDVKDGIEDVTDWFEELDDEGKKNIVMLGGIAAAAGPVLSVVGGLSTGIGGLMKVTGGLSKGLGKVGGKGLLGRIGLMGVTGGPVGLAIAGVGALGVGIYALTSNTEDLKEVNFDVVKQMEEEITTLENVTTKFDEMKEVNKLTKDEMLEYMDTLALLEQTSAPDKVKELKTRQEELLEKSGFTNKEMQTFIDLNDDIIEKAPGTAQAISSEGEAYVETTEAIKQLTEEKLREQQIAARNELSKALENEKTLIEEKNALVQDNIALEQELNRLSEKRPKLQQELSSEQSKLNGLNRELKELEEDSYNIGGEKWQQKKEEVRQQEIAVSLVQAEYDGVRKLIDGKTEEYSENQNNLESKREQLKQTEGLVAEYEQLILAQVDVNAERGKGLEALDSEIAKQLEIRNGLRQQKEDGELTTQEYTRRVQEAQNEIDKLRDAKGELQTINELAKTDVYSGRISDIQREDKELGDVKNSANDINSLLGKDINKNVDVDDNGTADKVHDEATKKGNKNVDVSLARRNSIWDLIPSSVNVGINLIGGALGFAKGTDSHPGGVSWLGEEGPELVKHNNKWAMASLGLYDVPKGAQVFTNKETTKMISPIPGFASGISPAGEADRIIHSLRNNPFNKLLALLGKQSNTQTQPSRTNNSATDYTKDLLNATLQQNEILMQLLAKDTNPIIDVRSLGKGLEPVITETQTRKQKVREKFGV
ncbi:phage tail tape measure protein [Gracilibacillus salinarum]|uniref:Phage tail tape measure protein n=1 Tax=Gracilibacillus salinarum TaxID=2932255 RepID=A0ABY4GND6_9BACI|nr:phage tail tape measure protein [Gracilibacillus salinarum]UOQ85696.1 phage tail tape measure protein [Gracilibacillus salinarum]